MLPAKATKFLVAFFCCVNFIAVWASSDQLGSKPSSARIYTAQADENLSPTREPLNEFDCTDKVFSVLEIENYPIGEYQFSVRWIDPTGELREHTQYPFWVRSAEEHRVWAWLLLSRARGAGMLTFINPAAGLEEFIGEWTLEVRLSNKLVDSHKFQIIC